MGRKKSRADEADPSSGASESTQLPSPKAAPTTPVSGGIAEATKELVRLSRAAKQQEESEGRTPNSKKGTGARLAHPTSPNVKADSSFRTTGAPNFGLGMGSDLEGKLSQPLGMASVAMQPTEPRMYDKEFSGFVSVADIAHDISEEHFEEKEHALHWHVAENAVKFRFRRQVRRSLLVAIGIEDDSNVDTDVLAIYSHSSDAEAKRAFIAIIVGFGSLSIPKAIAYTGLLPGCFLLWFFSVLVSFVCQRMIETPGFLERGFENLIQVASLAGSHMVRIMTVGSLLAWMAPCVLYFNLGVEDSIGAMFLGASLAKERDWYTGLPENVRRSTDKLLEQTEMYGQGSLYVAFLMFIYVALRTKSIKTVRYASKCSWGAMCLIAACTVLGSLYHAVQLRFDLLPELAPNATNYGGCDVTSGGVLASYYIKENITSIGDWRDFWKDWRNRTIWDIQQFDDFQGLQLWTTQADFLTGLGLLPLAYGGLLIVPYVVAEMVNPEKAPEVIAGGVRRISFYYFLVGMTGYLGFGEAVKCAPLPILFFSIGGVEALTPWVDIAYMILGMICWFCFIVKALSSFPLILWPLLRELKTLYNYFEDPAMELQLPWAAIRSKRTRMWWRLLFCLIVGGLVLLLRSLAEYENKNGGVKWQDLLIEFIDVFTTFLMSFLFPISVALFAIWRHGFLLEARKVRQEQLAQAPSRWGCALATKLNAEAVTYSGGSYGRHVIRTLWAYLTILALFLFAGFNLMKTVRQLVQ